MLDSVHLTSSKRIRILVYVSLFFLCTEVSGQPVNDDIDKRLPLLLNQALHSTTVKSSVQWNCLNQNLTRKCIKFHNDQWFEFNVPDHKDYFINISGQDCKDIWGVQAVIFKGIPCDPSSYSLITCYSDGNKDDIFIRLPPLDPEESYLLNIDGYLHDLCSFNIEFSDTPRGLPIGDTSSDSVSLELNRREVTLRWQIEEDDALGMHSYEIWKRTEEKYELLVTVPHEQNSLGEHRRTYQLSDAIEGRQADYMIIGSMEHDRILIGTAVARVDNEVIARDPDNNIVIPLTCEKGDDMRIVIYDAETDNKLKEYTFTYRDSSKTALMYNIIYNRAAGISLYKVLVVNETQGTRELLIYEK